MRKSAGPARCRGRTHLPAAESIMSFMKCKVIQRH
uniref:Uncharacterized protein n=1 Tax=Anguilla anguilla TaxID=7936 RepID=A0A0E9TIT1_ANGAN